MENINKLTLLGQLGKDAETRVVGTSSKTTFSVATTHGYKDKTGNWQNETTWHNVVLWAASDAKKATLKKGVAVYVEGRLENRSYEKDGVKKYITEVNADKVIPIGVAAGNGTQSINAPVELPEQLVENDDLPF